MNIYPRNIPRCQHIKVNGTQCGSPALRDQKYCYFHNEHREKTVRINANRRRTVAALRIPVLEDANSIQVGVMQVMRLLLGGYIEHKKAGLALYALQIASSNLARTTFEVGRPTKVVVDKKQVAETPLGMTPWSKNGKDHELDDDDAEVDYEHRRLQRLAMKSLEKWEPKTDNETREQDEISRLSGYSCFEDYHTVVVEGRVRQEFEEEWKKQKSERLERAYREDQEKRHKRGIDIQGCVDQHTRQSGYLRSHL